MTSVLVGCAAYRASTPGVGERILGRRESSGFVLDVLPMSNVIDVTGRATSRAVVGRCGDHLNRVTIGVRRDGIAAHLPALTRKLRERDGTASRRQPREKSQLPSSSREVP